MRDEFVGIIAMAIPIIAIVGGLTIAAIRVVGQIRIAELARRERIAAIERGIDPSKLPPLPTDLDEGYGGGPGGYIGGSPIRRAHNLMIAGLILLAVGISIAIFLRAVEPGKDVWALGVLPLLVGVALIVSSRIVWPKGKA